MYVSVTRKNQQLLATCDWMLYEALFVVPNCTGKHYLSDKHCRNDAECPKGASSWSAMGETVVRFNTQGFLTCRGRLEQIQSLDPTIRYLIFKSQTNVKSFFAETRFHASITSIALRHLGLMFCIKLLAPLYWNSFLWPQNPTGPSCITQSNSCAKPDQQLLAELETPLSER